MASTTIVVAQGIGTQNLATWILSNIIVILILFIAAVILIKTMKLHISNVMTMVFGVVIAAAVVALALSTRAISSVGTFVLSMFGIPV